MNAAATLDCCGRVLVEFSLYSSFAIHLCDEYDCLHSMVYQLSDTHSIAQCLPSLGLDRWVVPDYKKLK